MTAPRLTLAALPEPAEQPRVIAYVGSGTLANLLDAIPTTVWDWVRNGHLPIPRKIGGSARWKWSEVEKHIGIGPSAEEDPILKASRGG